MSNEYVFFDGFRTLSLSGSDLLNECVFFHLESRTLILTDIAVHFDESFPVLTQLATRVLGGLQEIESNTIGASSNNRERECKKVC